MDLKNIQGGENQNFYMLSTMTGEKWIFWQRSLKESILGIRM